MLAVAVALLNLPRLKLLLSLFDQTTPLPALTRVVISPTEGYHPQLGEIYCPYKLCVDGEMVATSELLPPDIFWLGQHYRFTDSQLPADLPMPLRSVLLGQQPNLLDVVGDWRRRETDWTRLPLFANLPLKSPEIPKLQFTVYVEEVQIQWAYVRVGLNEQEAASGPRETPVWNLASSDRLGQLSGPRENEVLVVQPAVRGLVQCNGQLLTPNLTLADPNQINPFLELSRTRLLPNPRSFAALFLEVDRAELVRLWQDNGMDSTLRHLGLNASGISTVESHGLRNFWLPTSTYVAVAPGQRVNAASLDLPTAGQALHYSVPPAQVRVQFYADH